MHRLGVMWTKLESEFGYLLAMGSRESSLAFSFTHLYNVYNNGTYHLGL